MRNEVRLRIFQSLKQHPGRNLGFYDVACTELEVIQERMDVDELFNEAVFSDDELDSATDKQNLSESKEIINYFSEVEKGFKDLKEEFNELTKIISGRLAYL